MRITNHWPNILALIVLLAALGEGLWWLRQEESYDAITIMAAQDTPENTTPIYAQFTVTQTLKTTELIQATELAVPLWSPAAGQRVHINLWRNDHHIADWYYETPASERRVVANVPLEKRLLDGQLTVEISAPTIQHEDHERAPRVFIETADDYYPDGNYRIAENEKSGDVALRLVGTRKRWERLWQAWRAQPLRGGVVIGEILLILMLIAAVPGVAQRLWRHRFGIVARTRRMGRVFSRGVERRQRG